MKTIGKPCEGEPHARFDVAGDGIMNNAPSLDPTLIHPSSGKDIANTKDVLFMAMPMINARGI